MFQSGKLTRYANKVNYEVEEHHRFITNGHRVNMNAKTEGLKRTFLFHAILYSVTWRNDLRKKTTLQNKSLFSIFRILSETYNAHLEHVDHC